MEEENNRTAMSLRIPMYYARLIGCSLDSLVGELEPEYTETALDRELYEAIIARYRLLNRVSSVGKIVFDFVTSRS